MSCEQDPNLPRWTEVKDSGERERKDTNPKDRVATSRLDLSLFPDTAVAYGALAMSEGDAKYGGYNYRIAGVRASVYYAACRRHLGRWFNGQWVDKKTGIPNLASALACIAILIDAVECNKLNDDRPPPVDFDALLAKTESLIRKLYNMFPNGPPRYTALVSLGDKPQSTAKGTLHRRGFSSTRRAFGVGNPIGGRRTYWGRRVGDLKLHCPGAI